MKTNLLTALRHLLTYGAGLGAFVATNAPPDQAGGVDPRAAGLGALAAVVVRYLLSLAPMVGARDGRATMSDTRGRSLAWALAAGLAGFFGFSPPACTPLSSLRIPPVRAGYTDEQGNRVRYSTLDGVTATVDRRGRDVTDDK